jgi:ABC-type uncharacterized transport system substrate-binding protein
MTCKKRSNIPFERTAGSRSLATAAQRDRWADLQDVHDSDSSDPGWSRSMAHCWSLVVRFTVTHLPIAVALLLATVIIAVPFAAEAQATGSAAIGVLGSGSQSAYAAYIDAFRQALSERGYVVGGSMRLDERWAEGRLERLPELAAELVRLKVDAILASGGTPVVLAARRATSEIPIVFTAVGDPVGQKLVDSLGRPGGNITGLSIMSQELGPKRLELLTQAFPNVTRIGVLTNLAGAGRRAQMAWMQDAARALKVDLRVFDIRRPDAIPLAFADMAKQQVGAVIINGDPVIVSDRGRPFALSMRYRLPAMVEFPSEQTDFLITFGPDLMEHYRRAAVYVDKILKGAKPADLPIEQPTKFRFVINLKTAKALGLTIPPSLLLRADDLVQ